MPTTTRSAAVLRPTEIEPSRANCKKRCPWPGTPLLAIRPARLDLRRSQYRRRPRGRRHGLAPRAQAEEQHALPSPSAHRVGDRHDRPGRLPRPRRLQVTPVPFSMVEVFLPVLLRLLRNGEVPEGFYSRGICSEKARLPPWPDWPEPRNATCPSSCSRPCPR